MADKKSAVLLTEDTYKRLKKLLDDYDNGFRDSIQLGTGLKVDERGTGRLKFSADPSQYLNSLPASNALNLNVCVNNVSTSHTFVITK